MVEGYYNKNEKWMEVPEDINIEKGEEIMVSYHSEYGNWNGYSILFWNSGTSVNGEFGSLFITNRKAIFCGRVVGTSIGPFNSALSGFEYNLDETGEFNSDDEWEFGKNVSFKFKKGSFFALNSFDSVLINSEELRWETGAREVVDYLNGPFIKKRKKSLEKKANELLNDSQTNTDSLLGAATNYKILGMGEKFNECITKLASKCERLQDFDGAIGYYKIINSEDDIIRLRKQKSNKVKVDQTVVHGDYVDDRDTTYVDDRDTIIQDSVISKSNVGAGGKSKAEQIKEIKELLDSGAIDKDDYEKMKREIIG